MITLLSRLRRDHRGVAAVEFALIAPVMIALYLGLAEFCQAYMAQKRMGHVAAMVADLVAQDESVNVAKLKDVFAISGLVMRPFSDDTLRLRVTSITRQSDGTDKVIWSYGAGIPRPADPVTDVPDDILVAGQSVIMAQAEYDYDSPIDYFLPNITTFKRTYFLRPRIVDNTTCSNCPAT